MVTQRKRSGRSRRSEVFMGRTRDTRQGSALLWTAVGLLMFIGFLVLSIDVGYMVWTAQRLQIGADAAAMAGALQVRSDTSFARLAAAACAFENRAAGEPIQLALNESNDPEGDIVIGRFNRDTGVFTPQLTAINAVKVVARRTNESLGGPVSLIFGPVLGFDTTEIQRMAIAMTGGGTGKGMVVLAEPDQECALYIYGDTDVLVDGGIVHINSANECSTCYQGSITLDAASIDSVGGQCLTGGGSDILTEQNTGVDPVADPLADLPAPAYDPALDLGTINTEGTYQPGYYSGGISLTGGTVVLEPGIYILDGAGLNVGGNTNLYAYGVMFYIIGTGFVSLTGTGDVVITPPDPDDYSYPGVDTYEGLAIFQARDNTNPGTIIGTSALDIQGTIYFPNNHMAVGGTATRLGSQFIVWTTEFFGNGQILVAFEGTVAAPGGGVYLVR